MEEAYVEKLASFYSRLKNIFGNERVQSALVLGASLGIGGALSEKISDILSSAYSEYKSKDYFDAMLKMHPQLANYPAEDIAKYWNSLRHFSPTVAEDPLAAGAFLTQSLRKLSGEDLGGPPPDTFATLTDIQKKYYEGNKKKNDKAVNMFDLVNKVSYDELAPRLDKMNHQLN